MSDTRRISTVIACCLLAAFAPFIAGIWTATLGLIPLACAVWLVARSGWSYPLRVGVVVVLLAATVGLAFGILILAMVGSD